MPAEPTGIHSGSGKSLVQFDLLAQRPPNLRFVGCHRANHAVRWTACLQGHLRPDIRYLISAAIPSAARISTNQPIEPIPQPTPYIISCSSAKYQDSSHANVRLSHFVAIACRKLDPHEELKSARIRAIFGRECRRYEIPGVGAADPQREAISLKQGPLVTDG